METTLTLSSQGQVVIPSRVRKIMGLKPGSKIKLSVEKTGTIPKAILMPQPENWVEYVTGLGKGVWGKGEVYIEKQRKSWNK